MKVEKLGLGIARSVAESMQILDTWFNILTAKKAASANRFKEGKMANRIFDDLIKGFIAGRDGQPTQFKTFHKEIENRAGKKINGRGLGAILRRIFRESGGIDWLNSDRLK